MAGINNQEVYRYRRLVISITGILGGIVVLQVLTLVTVSHTNNMIVERLPREVSDDIIKRGTSLRAVSDDVIKRSTSLIFGLVLWLSPQINFRGGLSTTVGVLSAGAAAGGLDARDIYQNCYDKDTGDVVNEWTCWVTVGAATVGAGFTMHRGVEWWNGGRSLVEEYNGNLYERIDLVTARSSFGVSDPATVRSNVLGGDVDIDVADWWTTAMIVTVDTDKNDTLKQAKREEMKLYQGNPSNQKANVPLILGGNSTQMSIRTLVPKLSTNGKRDMVGWGESHAGGIKVLGNSKGDVLWADAENWFKYEYGDPQPAYMMYKYGLHHHTWGMASKSGCDRNLQMIAIVEDKTGFGHNWETNQDWCWGGCRSNCQFSTGNEESCVAMQEEDKGIIQSGSSSCNELTG